MSNILSVVQWRGGSDKDKEMERQNKKFKTGMPRQNGERGN